MAKPQNRVRVGDTVWVFVEGDRDLGSSSFMREGEVTAIGIGSIIYMHISTEHTAAMSDVFISAFPASNR